MNCPKCNIEVPDGSAYCLNCGASLASSGRSLIQRVWLERGWRTRWILIGAAAAVVALGTTVPLFALGVFSGGGEPASGPLVTDTSPTPTASPSGTSQAGTATPTPLPSPSPESSPPPSEALVVFERGNGVWVIRSDGTGARLLAEAESGQWSLSPDGTNLAYIEPGDPFIPARLYVVPVSAGEPRGVFEEQELRAIQWSPGGGYVRVTGRDADFVIRISPEPEKVADFLVTEKVLKIGPNTIPDVASLTFTGDEQFVYVVCRQACTTHVRDIVTGVETRYAGAPECLGQQESCFSPDGEKSISPEKDAEEDVESFRILTLRDGTARSVGPVEAPSTFAWAPNSKRIAFVGRNGDGTYTLFAVDVGGGAPLPLTLPLSRVPREPLIWSEGSERVYFRDSETNLFVANADGTGGHNVGEGSVAFCKTPSGTVVGLSTKDYLGIQDLPTVLDPDDIVCKVSADFSTALLTQINWTFVIDLATGDKEQLLSNVDHAVWAGSCVSDGCPAVVPPEPQAKPETTVEIKIVSGGRFDEYTLFIPGDRDVNIVVDNSDSGIRHNFAVYAGWEHAESGVQPLAQTKICTGPCTDSVILNLPAGIYFFRCEVHPDLEPGDLIAE